LGIRVANSHEPVVKIVSTFVYTISMSSATMPSLTSLERLDLLRLRSELGLSRERMARLFDVSAKTIERWETQGSLPRDISSRRLFVDLRELTDLGTLIYGPEGFHRFLALPFPECDGATPFQLIELGQIDSVLASLAADYEGLGP
jgi:hypothetical protein